MALGIQALSLINKAAGIASMLYPVVPGSPIPKALLDKAETFFAYSNNCGVIEKMKEEGSTASKTVRGCDLREFSKFLKEKDAKGTFSGLRRVCDKSSGNAMWTTEARAKAMEEENKVGKTENEPHDEPQEVEQLNADITRLKAANQHLREQHEEVQTENQHLREQHEAQTENEVQTENQCCAVS